MDQAWANWLARRMAALLPKGYGLVVVLAEVKGEAEDRCLQIFGLTVGQATVVLEEAAREVKQMHEELIEARRADAEGD